MPGVPGVPSAEELSALPHAGLARLLSEAYRVCAEQSALISRLQARVEELERRAGMDSSVSSRPPSSDSPYKKKRGVKNIRALIGDSEPPDVEITPTSVRMRPGSGGSVGSLAV